VVTRGKYNTLLKGRWSLVKEEDLEVCGVKSGRLSVLRLWQLFEIYGDIKVVLDDFEEIACHIDDKETVVKVSKDELLKLIQRQREIFCFK
jgi:hypothetical protein